MMITGAPGANEAIANRSKVVMSPQEQQAAYDAWLQSQLARTNQLQGYQNAYSAEEQAYNDLWKTIARANAAGEGGLVNVSGGGNNSYYSPNYAPGVAQGRGVTDQLDGQTINRGALLYGHDLAAQVRDAMRSGTTFDPSKIGEGITDPKVLAAIQAYQNAYSGLPKVDAMGNFGPDAQPHLSQHTMALQDYEKLQKSLGDARALGTQGVNSWNQHIQDYSANQNRNGQAYLDMLGGGYVGGINPWATNPSWSGTGTPQWQAPQFANDSQLRFEAMQSPWGQAGAPFQQQAWAGGVLGGNPFTANMTNPFQPGPTTALGMAQETFQQQQNAQNTQAPQWFTGTFNPNSYNPQLATNAPWGGPFQNNSANGGSPPWFPTPNANPGAMNKPAQQNPMTFGQSPWGSW